MEHQPKLCRARSKGTHQGHGIRAAGEAHSEAQPGLEHRSFDRQHRSPLWRNHMAHPKMISAQCGTPAQNLTRTVCRIHCLPMYTPRVMHVFVILPAAGLGTRMAGPQPKQFLALDGVPILVHSLRAFAAVNRVTAIYVARSEEHTSELQSLRHLVCRLLLE